MKGQKKERYQRSPDYRVLALLEATCQNIVADRSIVENCHSKPEISCTASITKDCSSQCAYYSANGSRMTHKVYEDSTEDDDPLGLESFFNELRNYSNQHN